MSVGGACGSVSKSVASAEPGSSTVAEAAVETAAIGGNESHAVLSDWSQDGGFNLFNLDSRPLLGHSSLHWCSDSPRDLNLDLGLDVSVDSRWVEGGDFASDLLGLSGWDPLDDGVLDCVVLDAISLGPDGSWSFLKHGLGDGVVDSRFNDSSPGDGNLLCDGSRDASRLLGSLLTGDGPWYLLGHLVLLIDEDSPWNLPGHLVLLVDEDGPWYAHGLVVGVVEDLLVSGRVSGDDEVVGSRVASVVGEVVP